MRLGALGLIALGVAWGGAARASPLHVMSLNECADQIVLQLLPPERISSVTWLSRDPSGSAMAAAARRVPVNYGTAEEVAREKPDLVIAGAYTTPATRMLLGRLHYRVLTIGTTDSWDQIRSVTRTIAAAVGAQARGEALIAHMDATLKVLAADPGPPIRVAAWDGAGFSARRGSLYDAILKAAGAVNVAPDERPTGTGAPEVESLLAAAPALLVRGEPRFEVAGRRSDVAFHPLVRRFWKDRTVIVPQSLYICGTPASADAAMRVRAQLRRFAAIASTPLPFEAVR